MNSLNRLWRCLVKLAGGVDNCWAFSSAHNSVISCKYLWNKNISIYCRHTKNIVLLFVLLLEVCIVLSDFCNRHFHYLLAMNLRRGRVGLKLAKNMICGFTWQTEAARLTKHRPFSSEKIGFSMGAGPGTGIGIDEGGWIINSTTYSGNENPFKQTQIPCKTTTAKPGWQYNIGNSDNGH